MTWIVSAPQTAPVAAAAVLADAGPVTNANGITVRPQLVVTANATAVVTLQKRNTLNDTTIQEWNFAINGGGTIDIPFTDDIVLAVNERIRVVNRVAFNTANSVIHAMLGGV